MRLRSALVKAVEDTEFDAVHSWWSLKVLNLKKNILNGLSHIFGDYSKCLERKYFCNDVVKVKVEQNIIPRLEESGIYQRIMAAIDYLVNLVSQSSSQS